MATIEELKAQVQSLLQSLDRDLYRLDPENYSSLLFNNTDPFKEENARIERYLSEFTARQGVLLTIAGLLTLLPILTQESVNHFLIWSFPFLIGGIVCYIFSTKRINFLSPDAQPLDERSMNTILRQTYYSSLKFHKAADVFIATFLVTFILNYYIINFSEEITILTSSLVVAIGLLGGSLRWYYISSVKNDPNANTHATPCIPTGDVDLDDEIFSEVENNNKK